MTIFRQDRGKDEGGIMLAVREAMPGKHLICRKSTHESFFCRSKFTKNQMVALLLS